MEKSNCNPFLPKTGNNTGNPQSNAFNRGNGISQNQIVSSQFINPLQTFGNQGGGLPANQGNAFIGIQNPPNQTQITSFMPQRLQNTSTTNLSNGVNQNNYRVPQNFSNTTGRSTDNSIDQNPFSQNNGLPNNKTSNNVNFVKPVNNQTNNSTNQSTWGYNPNNSSLPSSTTRIQPLYTGSTYNPVTSISPFFSGNNFGMGEVPNMPGLKENNGYRLEDIKSKNNFLNTSVDDISNAYLHRIPIMRDYDFNTNVSSHSISHLPEYLNFSHEELRYLHKVKIHNKPFDLDSRYTQLVHESKKELVNKINDPFILNSLGTTGKNKLMSWSANLMLTGDDTFAGMFQPNFTSPNRVGTESLNSKLPYPISNNNISNVNTNNNPQFLNAVLSRSKSSIPNTTTNTTGNFIISNNQGTNNNNANNISNFNNPISNDKFIQTTYNPFNNNSISKFNLTPSSNLNQNPLGNSSFTNNNNFMSSFGNGNNQQQVYNYLNNNQQQVYNNLNNNQQQVYNNLNDNLIGGMGGNNNTIKFGQSNFASNNMQNSYNNFAYNNNNNNFNPYTQNNGSSFNDPNYFCSFQPNNPNPYCNPYYNNNPKSNSVVQFLNSTLEMHEEHKQLIENDHLRDKVTEIYVRKGLEEIQNEQYMQPSEPIKKDKINGKEYHTTFNPAGVNDPFLQDVLEKMQTNQKIDVNKLNPQVFKPTMKGFSQETKVLGDFSQRENQRRNQMNNQNNYQGSLTSNQTYDDYLKKGGTNPRMKELNNKLDTFKINQIIKEKGNNNQFLQSLLTKTQVAVTENKNNMFTSPVGQHPDTRSSYQISPQINGVSTHYQEKPSENVYKLNVEFNDPTKLGFPFKSGNLLSLNKLKAHLILKLNSIQEFQPIKFELNDMFFHFENRPEMRDDGYVNLDAFSNFNTIPFTQLTDTSSNSIKDKSKISIMREVKVNGFFTSYHGVYEEIKRITETRNSKLDKSINNPQVISKNSSGKKQPYEPTLTKEMGTNPEYNVLKKLSEQQLKSVRNFSVESEHGHIFFENAVDLTYTNLDSITFYEGGFFLDNTDERSYTNLYKSAYIVLFNCGPKVENCEDDLQNHISDLEKAYDKQMDVKFLKYDVTTKEVHLKFPRKL